MQAIGNRDELLSSAFGFMATVLVEGVDSLMEIMMVDGWLASKAAMRLQTYEMMQYKMKLFIIRSDFAGIRTSFAGIRKNSCVFSVEFYVKAEVQKH